MSRKVLFQFKLPMDGFDELPSDYELFVPIEDTFPCDEFLKHLSTADVLVSVFGQKVTKEMMLQAPNLKLIANYGVGYDNIDIACATKLGILVTNTPNPVTEPTAELAMGLMLAVARNIAGFNHNLRVGKVPRWTVLNNLTTTLYGKTLGIIGMGAIGRALARRALSFGMNIIYHNRRRLDEMVEQRYSASYTDFETLLRNADVVSLNVPGSAETHHLIGASEFKIMKPNAILINTARGVVIDEQVLIKALNNKEIAGAGLDVFENEPSIPEELLKMSNVVVTPHVGSATHETRAEMSSLVASIITRFYSGEKSIPIVNIDVLSGDGFRGKNVLLK